MSSLFALWFCVLTVTLVGICNGDRFTKKRFHSSHHLISSDPDINRNASAIIISRGYPVELHHVTTEDGFILALQRIPHGREASEPPFDAKPVAFLQHGLLADATNWILDGPSSSLAYILADRGFDVWLGNARGNDCSRRHVKYKPYQEEFWDWSWQEMADYDLPAMINYVLNVTGQEQLFYVGHSQGTLMGFTGFSENPELGKKVKQFFALAPVYTLNNCSELAIDAAHAIYPVVKKHFLSSTFELLPGDILRALINLGFCNVGKWSEEFCYAAMETVVGFDSENINTSRVPVYLAHFMEGTSFRDIIHFGQMIVDKKCSKFDFGEEGNEIHYKQPTPPLCRVQDMQTPTALFYGEKDALADPADVLALKALIKDLTHAEQIPKWNHQDFLYGMDAAKILYLRMVDMMKELV